MLTEGRLNGYLAFIDQGAKEMLEDLIIKFAEKDGITEDLKEQNQLEWVQKMNSIKAFAEESVIEAWCRLPHYEARG